MIIRDIVVAAFKLDQLVRQLLYTVQVEVAVRIRAILDYHLPVFPKCEVSGLEVRTSQHILRQVNRLIHSILMIIRNIVVATFKLDQLICMLHNVIQIEITVCSRAILLHILESKVDIILGGPLMCVASFLDNQCQVGCLYECLGINIIDRIRQF